LNHQLFNFFDKRLLVITKSKLNNVTAIGP